MAFSASSRATTTVIPMPMLKVLNISRRGTLPAFSMRVKMGSTGTLASLILAVIPWGKLRGMFS